MNKQTIDLVKVKFSDVLQSGEFLWGPLGPKAPLSSLATKSTV